MKISRVAALLHSNASKVSWLSRLHPGAPEQQRYHHYNMSFSTFLTPEGYHVLS
jgi:hypothetical protein